MRNLLLLIFIGMGWMLQAQPVNDDCDFAIDLGEAPVCLDDIYDNIDATPSTVFSNPALNIPTCWNSISTDVWFMFQVPIDGSVIDFLITLAGTPNGPNGEPLFQPELAVYRGDCLLDELDELACISSGLGQSAVSLTLEGLDPGLPYYLRVSDYSATATPNWGDFQICIDSLSNFVEVSANPDTICLGESVQLSMTSSDNFESFSWTPAQGLSNPTIAEPTAFPNQTTTYEVTALQEGSNLIVNGDFEAGNIGFLSEYTYGPDSLPIGMYGTLSYEGTYEVADDPSATHSNFAPCPDHTSGTGNMLIVNGSIEPNEELWCQTVNVLPNTDYLFSAWVTSVTFSNPAVLQFSIDDVLLNTPFSAPFGTCSWSEFTAQWNSGVNTTIEICITNQNTSPGGNDFALDDIEFRTFVEASDTVTIHVSNPQAQVTQLTDATCTGICNGNATLQASGGFVSGDYQYNWSNGADTATATDLCGGSYSVTVTDDIGCTAVQSLEIEESAFEAVAVSLVSPCAISTVGEAQAIADGGTPPYTYSWDNGEMTAIAINLSDGLHEVTVVDANGCTTVAEVEISTNPNGFQFPIETDQDSICAGESTTLFTTDAPGNTQFEWSTGATDVTAITVAPTSTTTYTLTAVSPGENLIINGDFEAGNLGFTSDYALGTGGAWGPLSLAGTYAVASNTNDVHSNFASCTDHTTGSGDMLIVNGSTQANENIWCQNVTVAPNTDYQFSTWIMTAISENPAILQFSINGTLLGAPFEAAFQTCDWLQFFEVWNSGSLTTAEICIVNQNVGQSGNDFALDDISLVPLCTSVSEQTIEVSNLEAQIINPVNIGCEGLPGSAEVQASLGIEPYTYTWSTGDNTPAAQFSAGGTYMVTVTDQIGCAAVQTVQIEAAAINIDHLIIQDLSCGETGSDFIVIIPGMITIEMGAGMPPFQYSLDNGTTFSTDNTFDNLDPGTYTILVEDEAGCQTTMEATVEDLSFPTVSIIASGAFTLCEGEDFINLELKIEGEIDSILWSTNETGNSIMVSDTGAYSVTVVNADNCIATDMVLVTDCGDFEIPNIFTPNGDGINDTFGLISAGAVQVLDFKVYNRWGQLVHDQITPWDGRYNNENHPSDVLAYRMELETPAGRQVLTGEVTLVR